MRFLLVMLAVAASTIPLVGCEATKAGEKDASALGNTKELASGALQNPGALQNDERPADERQTEELRAQQVLQATASRAAGDSASGKTIPGRTISDKNLSGNDLVADDLAAQGNHPATSGDEGGIDEGNGEPMDDVDDEEVPATDKSGVDHPPAADEEPEGTGIKLQE